LSAPVGFSMMGLSALPDEYELNLGMTGMHGKYAGTVAKSECDVLLALGVRFSDRATGNTDKYKEDKIIIHVDVDIAEMGKNITPQIEIQGDVKDVLTQLLPLLPELRNEEWLSRIEELKKVDTEPESNEFTPRNIIETVECFCDEDTVIATDVGQHQMWVTQYYKFKKPRTLLTSGGLGTMGYGLGAAIGGCIASGRKKTILFTGDGSFGMNLNEMATAVSQKLPLIILVVNNGVLGMVRQWQRAFYEENFSETTLNRKTDFVALAQSFGAKGKRATTLDELTDILDNYFDCEGPLLIDCHIDKDEKVLPMIPPGKSVKDMIVG